MPVLPVGVGGFWHPRLGLFPVVDKSHVLQHLFGRVDGSGRVTNIRRVVFAGIDGLCFNVLPELEHERFQ